LGTNLRPSFHWNHSLLSSSTQKSLLLDHIDKCPECLLYLLSISPNSSDLFALLNRIPLSVNATFYPLTTRLWYNQPVPYYSIPIENMKINSQSVVRNYWKKKIDNLRLKLNKNSILSRIYLSLKQPVILNNTTVMKSKLILYYTKFFGRSYWYNQNLKDVYNNDLNPVNCPISVNACHVTIDRNRFSKSDAALIHMRESFDISKLKQLKRRAQQRFIFFLKESPVQSPTLDNKYKSVFNWTQTYRPDSDITGSNLRDYFWLFDNHIIRDIDYSFLDKKDALAVAIISNCGGSSKRLEYIKEMKKHMKVDVYGRCGRKCPANVKDCRQFVYEKYKFYLAFENSLCDEYVSEKFLYALNSGIIVPVALGYVKYNHYVPKSGYLDVRDYQSPKE
ncbi:unnamed protein product, partial [Didymodactylos carnosus]